MEKPKKSVRAERVEQEVRKCFGDVFRSTMQREAREAVERAMEQVFGVCIDDAEKFAESAGAVLLTLSRLTGSMLKGPYRVQREKPGSMFQGAGYSINAPDGSIVVAFGGDGEMDESVDRDAANFFAEAFNLIATFQKSHLPQQPPEPAAESTEIPA